MIKYVADRFFSWMTVEPFIGLLMVLAAVVLFLGTLALRPPEDRTFWPWTRRIVEASATALLFLGLLWAFRAVLNDNLKTFKARHGRVSAANYQSLKTIWGAPHVQRELTVDHFVRRNVREELPRSDPTRPPIYRYTETDVPVPQNSIRETRGEAHLKLNERKKGSALYSGFDLSFQMQYVITNDSNETTEARFRFPLQSGQVQFKNVRVLEDGKDLSRELRVSKSGIAWTRRMPPGRTLTISVSYDSRGVEHFYYQIPQPREIRGFVFTLLVDSLAKADLNYPQGCLTPDAITEEAGRGLKLEWKLDRAITTAGMGIALPTPEQPGAKTALVLAKSPYAMMLLVVSISLTLLVIVSRLAFVEIALLAGAYSLLFISMAALHDYLLGFWGALVVGAAATLALAFLLFRRYEDEFLKRSVLVLTGFFTLVYPMAGLLPDHQAAFDGLVFSGLIVYLFLIVLRRQVTLRE